MDTDIIRKVQEAGFDVYMRDVSDTYMYYTDGKRIGYLQKRRWEMHISTVHKPNKKTGTGFQMVKNPIRLVKGDLEAGFARAPAFANTADLTSVKKYEDMAAFLGSSEWNQGFTKVPLVNPASKV